ncbi:MAG: biotin/lipoyl-binding protein [Candidatus Eisenbacteria bacterium]|nr:biotin/lipoyl-binding protein [Candidatus Eisenbacteria bacterium]
MKLKITVHGVAYEVEVEVLDPGEGFTSLAPLPHVQTASPKAQTAPPASVPKPLKPSATPAAQAPKPGDTSTVASPIAGTVVEVKSKPGDNVKAGDALLVIEAMKMNTSIVAPGAGRIRSVEVAAGDTVREGQTLVVFE